jgi:hypothetical protein
MRKSTSSAIVIRPKTKRTNKINQSPREQWPIFAWVSGNEIVTGAKNEVPLFLLLLLLLLSLFALDYNMIMYTHTAKKKKPQKTYC